jgi:NADP-dependent 3-hydroxy acid dehydrogenase YdfG
MEPKTVLVTGAGSGIGAATARRLAEDGHRVFSGARRTDRLRAPFHELDVTRRDSVEAFVESAVAEYGRIDVLVNNAGVMPLSPLADLRVADWEQMIDVNLRGVLYGIAAVLPRMLAQGAGHIVNVSSVSGHRVDPTAAVYCATKFGVAALSEGLRQESDTIRVTVISPGFTRTDLFAGDPALAAHAATLAIPPDAVAGAIAYAISQPPDVDVNEVVIRPTVQR